MGTSDVRVNGVQVAAFIAFGLEFAKSHGLTYACGLIQQMGADERTVNMLVDRFGVEAVQWQTAKQ